MTNTEYCTNSPDASDGINTDGGGNSLLFYPPSISSPNPCTADITGPGGGAPDGVVNVKDLLLLFWACGVCP